MKGFYSDVEKLMQKKYKEDNRDYLKLLSAGNTAQIEKLRMNDHKRGFDNIDFKYANDRFEEERIEYLDEMCGKKYSEFDFRNIRKEAADMCNFLFMIILKCDEELNR